MTYVLLVGLVFGGSEDELDAGWCRGEAQRGKEDDHEEKIPKRLLHDRVILARSGTKMIDAHHLTNHRDYFM